MKRINLALMVCAIALSILVFLPHRAIAEEELCFDKPAAAKLAADLQTCQDTEDRIGALIEKYSLEAAAQASVIENKNETINVLEDQYADCTAKSDELGENWKKATEAATECQKSKPSRWTWFSIGAGSGIGLALILILL